MTVTTFVNEVQIDELTESVFGTRYFNLFNDGKEIQVTVELTRVHVKVINAAAKAYRMTSGNLLGKTFRDIDEAADHYKTKKVRVALRRLQAHLIDGYVATINEGTF